MPKPDPIQQASDRAAYSAYVEAEWDTLATRDVTNHISDAVVATVRPLIEAETRANIAAAIRAERDQGPADYDRRVSVAAEIAERGDR